MPVFAWCICAFFLGAGSLAVGYLIWHTLRQLQYNRRVISKIFEEHNKSVRHQRQLSEEYDSFRRDVQVNVTRLEQALIEHNVDVPEEPNQVVGRMQEAEPDLLSWERLLEDEDQRPLKRMGR